MYVIGGLPDSAVTQLVTTLALQAERTAAATGVEIRKPRIGLYRPWQASMDEGWTRWILERYDFDFVSIYPPDVRAGSLANRLDVLIVADEARGLLDGYGPGSIPPQYEGGLGAEGVRAIDAFVRGGGTLVCLNRSSLFFIDHLKLPVKNAVGGMKRQEFFTGGSVLEVEVMPGHQVTAGLASRTAVFVDGSPAFETGEGFNGEVLARYPKTGSPLMSGYLLGERFLQGRAAALDVPLDRGHVVLIGFRPQWRGQPFGTFKVVFNAALGLR